MTPHPLIRFSSRDPTPPPPEADNAPKIKQLLAERQALQNRVAEINKQLEILNNKIPL